MAKSKGQSPSLSDYSEENFLDEEITSVFDDDDDEDEDSGLEDEDEEEEEPKAKTTAKPKAKKKVAKEEETEDEAEDESEEEKPKKVKAKTKAKEKSEEEVEDETKDSDETDESKKGDETESDESDEDETEDNSEEFFEEVEKITGLGVDVDYGDTDPLSPQGVAIREGALKEVILDNFLGEIEQKFPSVFRALKHANNGGDPAELFKQTMARDYSAVDLKEGDESLAKTILEEFYRSKGITNAGKIAKWIEGDEESEGGLVGEAKSALEELKKEQKEKSDKVIASQEQIRKDEEKRDGVTIAAIDEAIDSKQLGSFRLTDRAEAGKFREYVLKNIRKVAGGKYELSTPLDSSSLGKSLQYQYFQFKQGDLSKIIQQSAQTEVAKKLKLRLTNEQEKSKKSSGVTRAKDEKLSLSSYNED